MNMPPEHKQWAQNLLRVHGIEIYVSYMSYTLDKLTCQVLKW